MSRTASKRDKFILAGLLIVNAAIYGTLVSHAMQRDTAEVVTQAVPDAPDLPLPMPVTVPAPHITITRDTLKITQNVRGVRFEDCTLEIQGADGLTIADSTLIRTRVIIHDSRNVTLANNEIRDYYGYPDAAIRAYDCDGLLLDHNAISDSTGVYIVGGPSVTIRNNIFTANDQNSAIVLYAPKGVVIQGNLFQYNRPNAVYVLNPEADPDVSVQVLRNTFDANVGDAIRFQLFGGSTRTSYIYGNRISRSGAAGISVEYNSWGAGLVIQGNYIDNNGLLTQEILDSEGRPTDIYPAHAHQAAPYRPAPWQHGIRIEDASAIVLQDNAVIGNKDIGIEITNGRDVRMADNVILKNQVGLYVRNYRPASLQRQNYPLAQENAGSSAVIAEGNTIADNTKNDVVIERGSTFGAP